MSDTDTTTDTSATDTDTGDTTIEHVDAAVTADALGDAGKQALDRMKAERNEASSKLKSLQKELDKYKQAQMTEQERAVAAAKAEGYAEASQKASESAVMAILRANLQARGKSGAELDELLEPVTAKSFINDGEINTDKVVAFAGRLAPTAGFSDLGQGRREATDKPVTMSELIRRAAGHQQ